MTIVVFSALYRKKIKLVALEKNFILCPNSCGRFCHTGQLKSRANEKSQGILIAKFNEARGAQKGRHMQKTLDDTAFIALPCTEKTSEGKLLTLTLSLSSIQSILQTLLSIELMKNMAAKESAFKIGADYNLIKRFNELGLNHKCFLYAASSQ